MRKCVRIPSSVVLLDTVGEVDLYYVKRGWYVANLGSETEERILTPEERRRVQEYARRLYDICYSNP